MPSADSPDALSASTSTFPPPSKPFSISLSSKPKTISTSSSSVTPRKRPRSSLAEDSGSDSDGHERHKRGPQLVSAFDQTAGGAIGHNEVNEVKAPLIIRGQSNRNWRDESRRKRGRNLLPAEEQAAREGKDVNGDDVGLAAQQGFGLTIVKRTEDSDVQTVETLRVESNKRKLMTADEEALEALLEGKKKSDLVLPAIVNGEDGDGRFAGRLNEDDAFKSDIASRPDSASIDDYTAVPIEEFGAALLRGMGWKEGDVVGKRKNQVSLPRVVSRRPALLGIGAKEVPEGLEELGAWGKGAKAGKGKKLYTKGLAPVLLKNSKTGETLTEEELRAKKERALKEEEDWRQRRDRNLAIDEGRKVERGHREGDRSHASSRHSESRRDRSRSRDREERRRDRHRGKEEYRDEARAGKHRPRERREDSHHSSRHRQREEGRYEDTRSRKRAEVY
ncbi:hypothetical protein MMC13_000480 [Lambiella insularis]|nr:hypothetical protein [Lambiella insularis]